MLRPFDDNGHELDAHYTIEPQAGGFDLIVESRGGSTHGPNAARNSDYASAMELHLSRMRELGMVLLDLQVASSIAMKMPENERRVSLDRYALPLALSRVADLVALRHSIGRASAAFGRIDGSDRGNRTKRMRLRMQWPAAEGMPAEAIAEMLARPVALPEMAEAPTADADELSERVARAAGRIRAMRKRGTVHPPTGQKKVARTTGSASRFVRDPNVIAWVLHVAAGNCEVCKQPAPFHRDGGEPYLEVHHVRPLGQSGPDTTDNAVACCPNCHRQLHHDPERTCLRRSVIAAIARLTD